jgi:hypothetical protein
MRSPWSVQMDEQRFEDRTVEGVGNIKSFEGQTVDSLRSRLDQRCFCVFTALEQIPACWPKRIMNNAFQQIGGKDTITNVWQVNIDGKQWQWYYGFCLATYLQEIKKCPGFVYERKKVEGKWAYVPIVSVLFALDGLIKQASATWCESVLKKINEPQKRGE